MRPGLSLKWVIGAGASLVLSASLAIYVHIVSTFSEHALDYIASYMLEDEALYFSRRYEKDPLTPLPHGPAFSAAMGMDALPEDVRSLLQVPPVREIGTVLVFDAPSSAYIQVQPLHDGKTLYLFETQHLDEAEAEEYRVSDQYLENRIWDLMLIGLSVPVIALLLIAILVYRVISPLRRLTRWSATVGASTPETMARPDFCYIEFNLLAKSLSDSISQVKAAALREERLLRYTSHELRTPLAVLKANLQLLEVRGELSAPLQRIQRSVRDMQGITETLLWMSSGQSTAAPETNVDIDKLLDELLEDNRHLISTRPITLMLKVEQGPYPLPANACRIIIGNLLRNALQYTDEGCIEINCNTQALTIINRFANTPAKAQSADYGYGLGLELVHLLCEKLGWHLHQHNETHLFAVTLLFASPPFQET